MLSRMGSMRGWMAASSLALVGCATPGISYLSSVPAGDPLAASYRAISVGAFDGPEGGWYTHAFEAMLVETEFEGGPWFIVHDPAAPPGTYEAQYSGFVDIVDIDVDTYTRTKKKCVEWDGLFDCEHRADVLQACLDVDVDVAVTTRLSDVRDGAIVFQETYRGRSGDRDCDDVKIVSGKYAGRLKGGHGRFGHYRNRFGSDIDYLTVSLVQDALRDTLGAVRRDVAPYTERAKAPLLAEAIDPEVRADPRFAHAVSAAEEGAIGASCVAWDTLMVAYPHAPGVRHNAGACAEAGGDLAAAQALYAGAVERMGVYRRDGEAFETLLAALGRISDGRANAQVLSDLTGQTGAVPVDGESVDGPGEPEPGEPAG